MKVFSSLRNRFMAASGTATISGVTAEVSQSQSISSQKEGTTMFNRVFICTVLVIMGILGMHTPQALATHIRQGPFVEPTSSFYFVSPASASITTLQGVSLKPLSSSGSGDWGFFAPGSAFPFRTIRSGSQVRFSPDHRIALVVQPTDRCYGSLEVINLRPSSRTTGWTLFAAPICGDDSRWIAQWVLFSPGGGIMALVSTYGGYGGCRESTVTFYDTRAESLRSVSGARVGGDNNGHGSTCNNFLNVRIEGHSVVGGFGPVFINFPFD